MPTFIDSFITTPLDIVVFPIEQFLDYILRKLILTQDVEELKTVFILDLLHLGQEVLNLFCLRFAYILKMAWKGGVSNAVAYSPIVIIQQNSYNVLFSTLLAEYGVQSNIRKYPANTATHDNTIILQIYSLFKKRVHASTADCP